MNIWKPGDRVAHATFGAGTVLECTEPSLVVHFDDHGRKKLAARVAVLTPAGNAGAPASRRSGSRSERPTDIGYENLNEQVVSKVLAGDAPGQSVVELTCRRCQATYGARPADILLRRCPACMGGPPGLPV